MPLAQTLIRSSSTSQEPSSYITPSITPSLTPSLTPPQPTPTLPAKTTKTPKVTPNATENDINRVLKDANIPKSVYLDKLKYIPRGVRSREKISLGIHELSGISPDFRNTFLDELHQPPLCVGKNLVHRNTDFRLSFAKMLANEARRNGVGHVVHNVHPRKRVNLESNAIVVHPQSYNNMTTTNTTTTNTNTNHMTPNESSLPSGSTTSTQPIQPALSAVTETISHKRQRDCAGGTYYELFSVRAFRKISRASTVKEARDIAENFLYLAAVDK